jgi:hypothetical protein
LDLKREGQGEYYLLSFNIKKHNLVYLGDRPASGFPGQWPGSNVVPAVFRKLQPPVPTYNRAIVPRDPPALDLRIISLVSTLVFFPYCVVAFVVERGI